MPDRYLRRWCEQDGCDEFRTSPYASQRERRDVEAMFKGQGAWRCSQHEVQSTAASAATDA